MTLTESLNTEFIREQEAICHINKVMIHVHIFMLSQLQESIRFEDRDNELMKTTQEQKNKRRDLGKEYNGLYVDM